MKKIHQQALRAWRRGKGMEIIMCLRGWKRGK